jgi:hypothetical protein
MRSLAIICLVLGLLTWKSGEVKHGIDLMLQAFSAYFV